MSNNPFNKNICEINIQNNLLVSCIVKINTILPGKFYFTKESIIDIPKIIEIENIDKRTCFHNKDFDGNVILSIKKFKINENSSFMIPYFKSNSFVCLSCNRLHTSKSEKCCDSKSSIIKLNRASLYKIAIPDTKDINFEIDKCRDEFFNLHFPDVLDTIMLR